MKLRVWVQARGVSCRTALDWFHAGTLSVSARRCPTATILVESQTEKPGVAVAYRRVSSRGREVDLERRVGRVRIRSATLSFQRGRWHVSFSVELPDHDPTPRTACAACGLVLDRDENTAVNLAALAGGHRTVGAGAARQNRGQTSGIRVAAVGSPREESLATQRHGREAMAR